MGRSGAVERQFCAAGGWQQLLCIMESYLPAQEAVSHGGFSLPSRHPAFARAEEGGSEMTSQGG